MPKLGGSLVQDADRLGLRRAQRGRQGLEDHWCRELETVVVSFYRIWRVTEKAAPAALIGRPGVDLRQINAIELANEPSIAPALATQQEIMPEKQRAELKGGSTTRCVSTV